MGNPKAIHAVIGAVGMAALYCSPLAGQTDQYPLLSDQAPKASPANQGDYKQQFLTQQIHLLIAGYLSEFPFYVTWPKEAFEHNESHIVVGLIGPNPLGEIGRQYLSQRSFRGRAFKLVRLKANDPADKLRACQILYMQTDSKSEVATVLHKVKGYPVLTVGTSDSFRQDGGMVQFLVESGAVNFTVNAPAAKKVHIQVDPLLTQYGLTL